MVEVAALDAGGRTAQRDPPAAPLRAYQNIPRAAAVVVSARARWSACTVAEFSKKFLHMGLRAKIYGDVIRVRGRGRNAGWGDRGRGMT